MASVEFLEGKREKIQALVVRDESPGVCGVGVDSLGERLVVFYENIEDALTFLDRVLAGPEAWKPYTVLVAADVSGTSRSGVRQTSRHFFRRIVNRIAIRLRLATVCLGPGDLLRPVAGKDGTLGCFVELKSGEVVGLTAEHICARSISHAISRQIFSGQVEVGDVRHFGRLDAGRVCNIDDACGIALAISTKMHVGVPQAGILTGRFVKTVDFEKAILQKRAVACVAHSREDATVVDLKAVICRNLIVDGIEKSVLMCRQVMLKGAQDFAIPGDSGAIMLLHEDSPGYSLGDAFGLMSFIAEDSDYCLAAPIEECIGAIGGSKIVLGSPSCP